MATFQGSRVPTGQKEANHVTGTKPLRRVVGLSPYLIGTPEEIIELPGELLECGHVIWRHPDTADAVRRRCRYC